jgi:hypothetical protein
MKTLAERSWKKVKHALHIGMGKQDYIQSPEEDIKTQTDEAITNYGLHVKVEEKAYYWAMIRNTVLLELQQHYQGADTDKETQKAIDEFLQIIQYGNDKTDILLSEKELDPTEEKMRIRWQRLISKKDVLEMILKLDAEQFRKFFDILPLGYVLSFLPISNVLNERLSIAVDKSGQGFLGKIFTTKYSAKESYIAQRFEQFSKERLTHEPTALGTNVWAVFAGLYLVGQWNESILKYYVVQLRNIVKQDEIFNYYYLLPSFCMVMEDKEFLQRFHNFDARWKQFLSLLDGKQKEYLEKTAVWISSDNKDLSETIIEDYKNPKEKRHFIHALKMLDEQQLLDSTDFIKIVESYINLSEAQIEAKKDLKKTFIIPSLDLKLITLDDILKLYKNAIGQVRTEISKLCIDLIKNVNELKESSENPNWIKEILDEYLKQPIQNFPFQEMINIDWGSNNPILLRCLIGGLELGTVNFEVIEHMILGDLKLLDELKRDTKKQEIWVNRYASRLSKGEATSGLARVMLLNGFYSYDNELHNQMVRWAKENVEEYAPMVLEFLNKDLIPLKFYKDWLDFFLNIFKNGEGKIYSFQVEQAFRKIIYALSRESTFAHDNMDGLTPEKIDAIANAINMGKLLWFLKEDLNQIEYYIKYNLLIRNHYDLILNYMLECSLEIAKAIESVLLRGFLNNRIGAKHWLDLLLSESNGNPRVNVFLGDFIESYSAMLKYDDIASLVGIIKHQLHDVANKKRFLTSNEFWLISICIKGLFPLIDILPNLIETARSEYPEAWLLFLNEIEAEHIKPSQYLEILSIVRELLKRPSFTPESELKNLVRRVVNAIDAKSNQSILTMLNESDISPMSNEERINILPSMR